MEATEREYPSRTGLPNGVDDIAVVHPVWDNFNRNIAKKVADIRSLGVRGGVKTFRCGKTTILKEALDQSFSAARIP
ncbi:hypothetical protein [Thioclava sp. F42-5]|uniref:hypothetical protein n=1 Tax=Thioclava sp. F42-5 TaxID=1973005 RepID=UPI001F0A3771|nr:hypothetical protein [Thioclava sp. F42-5]